MTEKSAHNPYTSLITRLASLKKQVMSLFTGLSWLSQDKHLYSSTRKELCLIIAGSLLLCLALLVTFYQSIFGLVMLVPVFVLLILYGNQRLAAKKKFDFMLQFKDVMGAVTSALQAGYALDHAFEDAYGVCCNLYGKDARITGMIGQIVSGRKLNIPIDQLLSDFAQSCGLSTVGDFVDVVSVCRRYGGNLPDLLAKQMEITEDELMIRAEVLSATASIRYEAYVMDFIPPAIIWYLNFTGAGFIKELYHSAFGFVFMSVCLYIYLATVLWQFRIMDKTIG